jgi:hypothetical protein
MSRALGALVLASVIMWRASAGTVYWNFDTEMPTSNGAVNVTAGLISRGNGGSAALLSAVSVSAGCYSGASGGSNAVASAVGGVLSTNASTFFQFTLTPGSGMVLRLTNLCFGVRCTATGPQAYSVRSSQDGYAAEVAGGTVLPNSSWALKRAASVFQSTAAGEPVTFRIYGHSGTDNVPNWRIDDLSLEVAAAPLFPLGSVFSVK